MKIFAVQQKGVIAEAVAILRAGGVVMHPTETCYGFAVDVANAEAVRKLYKLKGRDDSKPVSIMVADLEMAKKYGKFSEKAIELAEKYWPRTPLGTEPWHRPGPLTILVPSGDKFVGMRCPDHKFSRELVEAFGSPVTTTSANLSGELPLYKANVESLGELAGLIDLVVDGGEIPLNKPSTIVKVLGWDVEIIREGDLKVV